MSSESSLHSPSSARGYSPAIHTEYGRRCPPGSTSSFRHQHEVVARARIVHVDASTTWCRRCRSSVPSSRTSASSTGDGPSVLRERAQLVHAVAHDARERRHHARHALTGCRRAAWGSRRHRRPPVRASMSSFVRSHARSCARMSIESVLATAPEPARLLRAVHPDFERMRVAVLHVADEDRELAEGRFHHVGPRRDCLPASFGRPGQRRLESAGCGAASSRMRRSRAGVEIVRLLALRMTAPPTARLPSTPFGR